MQKSLILLFLFFTSLFAYDSIEVLNPNITVHKSGYFKTDKDLTPELALQMSKEANLTTLPPRAYALPLTTEFTWFVFELSTTGMEKLYLDSKDIFIGSSYELFVFYGGKLIHSCKNGNSMPVEKRDIKLQQIRFLLEPNATNVTYMLKASNSHPLLPVFSLGNFEEVSGTWTNLHSIMLISYFIAISFLLYNMVLFFITKDKSFGYYCLYIFSLLLVCISGRSYLPFGIDIHPDVLYATLTFSLISSSIGAALFAKSFLNLKDKFPNISKILDISMVVFAILSPLSYYTDILFLKILFLLSLIHISLYIFYAALRVFLAGYITGLYFMLSTGIGLLLIFAYMIVFYIPNLFVITTWSITLVHQAVIWDVIMLSIALAYRIKLLQKEKEQAQKLIAQKAKFTTIGETIGNIAHQWRQPLGRLGSANASVEFDLIRNNHVKLDKLKEFVAENKKILDMLTQTIETFQDFFTHKPDTSFDMGECVKDVLTFCDGVLSGRNIKVELAIQDNIVVTGAKNEFFQAIINIIMNAKDALIENNTPNPKIDIKLQANGMDVTLVIEDNGGGIKIEPIESIFEPYVSTKGLNGMGIGLYTTKMIVEKMGGSIEVQNTKDGARFSVVLPRKK